MATKIGILSDTHGNVSDTKLAVELFRRQGVSVVLHCGDIGGAQIVRLFQGIEAHFVYGNMDGQSKILKKEIAAAGGVLHGATGSLEIEGVRIFFLHGHDNSLFHDALNAGDWNLICYGHTHQAELRMHGNTLVLNPGAFVRVSAPRVAVVTLPDLTVDSFDLCQ